jgi:arsenical resistance protein ArsH
LADTPNLEEAHFKAIDMDRLMAPARATHAPRILLLYGSLRDRSFSRLMTEEAARILTLLGGRDANLLPIWPAAAG